MRGSSLLDKMELIDDKYVESAQSEVTKKHRNLWPAGGIAAAACLTLALLAGTRLLPKPASPDIDPNLPMLSVEEPGGSFGFEGYLAYSPDELTGNCPWNESMELETLPVYRNRYPADGAGYSPVEQQVKVEFDPPVELPEYLNFNLTDASYADLEEVAEYLKKEYADVLNMVNPVTDIQGGDRNIYGSQLFHLYFYEGDGDTAQQLVARDLKCQRWCGDMDGKLWLYWKSDFDLSEKLGDYPVISAKEARSLLCKGNYITTVPYAMPGKQYIVKTELLYRSDVTAQVFMPYYRFLVEIPEAYFGYPRTEDPAADPSAQEEKPDDGGGMKNYGAYYVPAVRSDYLTEMPVWDGSFN